ncbi:mg282 protein [Chrysochromulina tobinii]|uniref:Mg282 protein n=1 Tax=Chrysochromulina tobinii TaxID=1460289 RepID=A0A0M0JVP9_9EUKA|nr:mg282 protein [Chrysochromulina tobinii]|eukprot:KOO30614.1 mg282 protein [Chrysochromulina sp. CCMP291]
MSGAFVAAMDLLDSRTVTSNGDACLKKTSSGLLDLFFKLVRGLDAEELASLFSAAVTEATEPEAKADLIVLAFQTRATRGSGKGEKDLAYQLFKLCAKEFGEEPVAAVLDLLPLYGYWKDLVHLLASDDCPRALADKSEELLCKQLLADEVELTASTAEKRTPSLSLVAKYAPREGTKFDKGPLRLAQRLAQRLFGSANPAASARKYRKLCSSLNSQLCTTEVLMAAGRWEEIRFDRVASLCLQRHRKAFLNEELKGVLTPAQDATGNRHPDDPARVAARLHLREAIVSKKGVQGKALMPHEIVQHCMGGSLSTLEADLMNAQWTSLRAGTLEVMRKAAEQRDLQVLEAAAPATAGFGSLAALERALPKHVDLGKLVALVDVSGSMSGTPMEAAIALGILVSELAAPTFRDRVLTFESVPNWVDLSSHTSICDKVRACQKAPWGGSTDFEAACFPVAKDTPNVQLLSGYSPALLKLVVSGADLVGDEEEVTETAVMPDGSIQTTTKVVRSGPTPEQTLRTALDDAVFDAVRLQLAALEAGPFKDYAFAPKEGAFEMVAKQAPAPPAVGAASTAAMPAAPAPPAEDDFEVVDAN